jgi:hypothetical protein
MHPIFAEVKRGKSAVFGVTAHSIVLWGIFGAIGP